MMTNNRLTQAQVSDLFKIVRIRELNKAKQLNKELKELLAKTKAGLKEGK